MVEDLNASNMRSNNIITGLATEWPPKLVGTEQFERYASRLYPPGDPWLQSMIKINENTGIESRSMLNVWQDLEKCGRRGPDAEEVDKLYRRLGPPIAAEAARRALHESNISPEQITHMVAVTATNVGSPGYDHLVADELGISDRAERILLSGVGCAGGLAAMRVASHLADAATLKGRPARVLVVACEICSIQFNTEMNAAFECHKISIAPLLFGDGAAAMVLCNSKAADQMVSKVFEIAECRSELLPHTTEDMSYSVTSHGFLLRLSKEVPGKTATAVRRPFEELRNLYCNNLQSASDFAWALHTGGKAIIQGVQEAMDIPEDGLKSCKHIYRTRGNIASVSVLAVLDHMRTLPEAKRDVIACSFGPGLSIEMALLKRMS